MENTVQPEMYESPTTPPPRTATVVAMLIAAALIISYLWAYAVTNALVAAEVISRWPIGSDPRPRRMCIGFVVMMMVFTAIAGFAQWISRRQLKRIDEMEEESEQD